MKKRSILLVPPLIFFCYYEKIVRIKYFKEFQSICWKISRLDELFIDANEKWPLLLIASTLGFIFTYVLSGSILISTIGIIVVLVAISKDNRAWLYVSFGFIAILCIDNDPTFFSIFVLPVLYGLSIVMIKFFKEECIDLSFTKEQINKMSVTVGDFIGPLFEASSLAKASPTDNEILES